MLMHRALLLLSLCLAIPAQAGILEDDQARQQIKELGVRVLKLDDTIQLSDEIHAGSAKPDRRTEC